ncbi:Protein of unknown function [Cotesia congregata]|uniref:Uncharacterized protein n=1 Tax=Cotesia congregata TaxID=51543 RepID=A0A8J2HBN3_COTCN|nr:Protein of unknown function [Cotesia congregata]
MKEIAAACDASMPRLKTRSFHRLAYWWSPDIAELRKKCHKQPRLATRAAKRSLNQELLSSETLKILQSIPNQRHCENLSP